MWFSFDSTGFNYHFLLTTAARDLDLGHGLVQQNRGWSSPAGQPRLAEPKGLPSTMETEQPVPNVFHQLANK